MNKKKKNYFLADKIICQSTNIDRSAGPNSLNRLPYMVCANDGLLSIVSAKLLISTRAMCPLQFTGINHGNTEPSCKAPSKLFNTDATVILQTL